MSIKRMLRVGELVRCITGNDQVPLGSEGRVTMGLTDNRSSVNFDPPAEPYAFWVYHDDLELVVPDPPDARADSAAAIREAVEIMEHARYRNHDWSEGCAMCDKLAGFIEKHGGK